jgi:hypothetical protein
VNDLTNISAADVSALPAAGFPGHNVTINPDKTQLNFTLQLPGGASLQPNTWSSGDE